ncbi:MAG: XrtA/PEP-CTERM system histidine kinase PrsK [Halioglobus sp.]
MQGNVGFYSYGLTFLSYAVLTFALLLIWRNRSLSLSVVLAAVITSAWAGIVSISTLLEYPPVILMQAAEVARNAGWLFLLLAIYGARLRGTDHTLGGRRWLPWYMVGLSAIIVILFAAPVVQNSFNLPPIVLDSITSSVWLIMSLVGLLLLENIYRNSSDTEKWWSRYLCLGVGFLFAYDFLMYSEALMLQRLNHVMWQSRGFAIVFTVPLIALAAARSRDRRATVQYSRHVVFHTFTLLVAGLYLIFMAVVGYFVTYLGGTWSGVLQITFLSAAGLFLLVLLFSGRLRARSRVWLSKNFFSYKYDYRREWLEFTNTLAGGADDTPQAIIQAMAKLAHCRAGVLWVRGDDGRFHREDQWQMDATSAITEYPGLNSWLEETGWIIDVEEWRKTPGLYVGLDMPVELRDAPGAWVVVPLLFDERLQGILMMRRSGLREKLNWEDRDLYKVAGRQAASHLVQYQSSAALVEMRQFETFNRLSAYVIHDLKNILAQQSLIVSNAAKHRGNPEFFDDVIKTVRNSVDRMTRLMEQMRSGERGGKTVPVELGELLRDVASNRSATLPLPSLDLAGRIFTVKADRERLATVFGHIIQNAKDSTTKRGKVDVRLSEDKNTVVVEIEDDGVGMSESFIKSRLFRPFDSTKGLTGMGIGAFESREFIRSIGGDILVHSQEGVGSCFRIVLPCAGKNITIKSV